MGFLHFHTKKCCLEFHNISGKSKNYIELWSRAPSTAFYHLPKAPLLLRPTCQGHIAFPIDGSMQDSEQDLPHVIAVERISAIKGKIHEDSKCPPEG